MKRFALILALVASPVIAQEDQPDFVYPTQGIIYTDTEYVVNSFGCALAAAAIATGPSGAVAAAAVVAAGGCVILMDLGLALPEWDGGQ